MLRLAKVLFQDKGLTQRQAASLTGLHQSRLSLIARDKAKVTEREKEALARVAALTEEWQIPELLGVVYE